MCAFRWRPWSSLVLLLLTACAGVVAATPPTQPLTLDQIMADPDWIGAKVETIWWSWNHQEAYYTQKRAGSQIRDIIAVNVPGTGRAPDSRVLTGAERADMDGAHPVFNPSHTQMAFIRNGDVFVRDLDTGALTQLTRTEAEQTDLQWGQGGLVWNSPQGWFRWSAHNGIVTQAALLMVEDAPDAVPEPDLLRETQLRLFDTLRLERERRDKRREQETRWRREDPTRSPPPVYMGKTVSIEASALSPDGRWLLVVTAPKPAETGQAGQMPRYVTESGYEDTEKVRTRVGRNAPPGQRLWLVDMHDGIPRPLALDGLPGIDKDPLSALRRSAGLPALSGPRPVRIEARGAASIVWNDTSTAVALMLHSVDNKDRWLVSINPQSARVHSEHRLSDPGWINWDYNEFGWLRGTQQLWFLSEHSGYSHLYVTAEKGRVRALTQGAWEVSAPVQAQGNFLFLCNRAGPGAYEVCQVPAAGGEVRELTAAGGGIEAFVPSPDGAQLLVRYSASYLPPQLALVGTQGQLQPLTDTRSDAYRQYDWLVPEYVEIPSRHGAGSIAGKYYGPQVLEPGRRYPIVLFVHGAGYLQNVTRQYPNYFREQMFHNLLVQRGYIVLDLDYRGSKGYGRDWRTAIYRQMGHPELEDYLDGIEWLVAEKQGAREKVGIYGGSYGGFMTFMALFREPGAFKAGAALRPVADWRHYNHSYTSNILNTPDIDPEAYLKSSPIEYAHGLQGHLLIAHGMIDDNVFYQDSVLLAQRLIELRKDQWEMASYPLERHGYVHADSWYDQYRRVLELFERTLKQ